MAKKRLTPETILVYTLLGEAASEGPEGMAAVAHVLKNRSASGTLAGMASKALVKKQFSFWNRGQSEVLGWINRNTSNEQRAEALSIVRAVQSGSLPDPTGGAKHYYANQGANAIAEPGWFARTATAGTVQIGNHIFAAERTPDIDLPAYTPVLRAAMVGAPIPARMSPQMAAARTTARLAQPIIRTAGLGVGGVTPSGLTTRTVQTVPVRNPILKTANNQTDTLIDLMSTRGFWDRTAVGAVTKKQLLAESQGVRPLLPSDAPAAQLPRAATPAQQLQAGMFGRGQPTPVETTAAVASEKSTVPKTAKMKNGKLVEVGKTYTIGGTQYVGGVDAAGMGTLEKVPPSIMDEANKPTIVGGIIRGEIAKGVEKAKIEAQGAAPLLVGAAVDTVGGLTTAAVEGVGGFFGGLFGGKEGATAPKSNATAILESIHDRRETMPVSAPKASWLPFPPVKTVAAPPVKNSSPAKSGTTVASTSPTKTILSKTPVAAPPVAPKPVTPPGAIKAGAAVAKPVTKLITKTVSVPKQIKVANPAWGKVSPEAIAKLNDIHDKEEARIMQAQTPQFITKTVMEQRTIQTPVTVPGIAQPAQGASTPQQTGGVTAAVGRQAIVPPMTAVQRLQAEGLSPADAYAEANRQAREKAAKKAGTGTTSSGAPKTTYTGESWAAAFGG